MQRTPSGKGGCVFIACKGQRTRKFFLLFKKAEFQQLKHKLLKFSLNALLTSEHSHLDP